MTKTGKVSSIEEVLLNLIKEEENRRKEEEYELDLIKDRFKNKQKNFSEFMNKYSDILAKEVFQEKSEIEIFNKIGELAINKNYNVVFFKAKVINSFGEELKLVDMHYIHIYKNEELKISIFYDREGTTLSYLGQPYYELYNGYNTKCFLYDEEDKLFKVADFDMK